MEVRSVGEEKNVCSPQTLFHAEVPSAWVPIVCPAFLNTVAVF